MTTFGGRSWRGGPPPVCTKPPLSGPLVPPGAPAWKIHAYARWRSEHYLRPTDQTRLLEIPWNPFTNRYHGPVAFETPMLRITALLIPATQLWQISLMVWDRLLNGKSYTWNNVPVPAEKPFDTRLLSHSFIGYINQQEVRLTL